MTGIEASHYVTIKGKRLAAVDNESEALIEWP